MVVAGPATEYDGGFGLVWAQLRGPFAIYLGDNRAGLWPRLSSKRLLALVFMSPKRSISREVARDTLFRDLAPRAASSALYNAVSSARAVLAALGEPAAAVLASDRTDIFISPGVAVEVDLDVHKRAIAAALAMSPGPGRDGALTAALSEQGVLLEDELYADWSARRRDCHLPASCVGARVAGFGPWP